MVKDLKRILGMVSLDIYQITNYSSYSKKHIICLIFKRFWIFHEHQSVIVQSQVLFNSKSDYLKCQCFGSIGSEGGKMFIQTDLFLTMITNFFKFKTIENHFFISYFINFQFPECNA